MTFVLSRTFYFSPIALRWVCVCTWKYLLSVFKGCAWGQNGICMLSTHYYYYYYNLPPLVCEQKSLWVTLLCNVWARIIVTDCNLPVQCVSWKSLWLTVTVIHMCSVWAGITVTDCAMCEQEWLTDSAMCVREWLSLWLTVQSVSRNRCDWLCTACNVWTGITVTDRAMCEQESLWLTVQCVNRNHCDWLCTVWNVCVWESLWLTVQCVCGNHCDWQCNAFGGITVTDCAICVWESLWLTVQCVSRNHCDWLCTVCNVWAGITITVCSVWAGITVTDSAMCEQESLWLTVQCVSRNHCDWLCTVCNVWAGINVAGVKWVIRLQLVLLLVLFLSAMDLLVGSFVHTDPGRSIHLTSISLCLSDSCLCLCDICLSDIVWHLCLSACLASVSFCLPVWHLYLSGRLISGCLVMSVSFAWCLFAFFLVCLTSVFHYSVYLWLTWCSTNLMPSGFFLDFFFGMDMVSDGCKS